MCKVFETCSPFEVLEGFRGSSRFAKAGAGGRGFQVLWSEIFWTC